MKTIVELPKVADDTLQHRLGLEPVCAEDLLAQIWTGGGLPHDRHRIGQVLPHGVGDPDRDGEVTRERALTQGGRAPPDARLAMRPRLSSTSRTMPSESRLLRLRGIIIPSQDTEGTKASG